MYATPGTTSIYDEKPEFQNKANLAVLQIIQELTRLQEAMMANKYWGNGYQNDWLKELRVCTAVLYYTGIRPSEAVRIEAKNIDAGRLTLKYLRTKRKNKTPDMRILPIPAALISFLANEGRMEGRVIRATGRTLENNMKKAAEAAQVGGVSLKTFRKDFAFRARQAGVSRDDLNLYQGREESILEHHYTTDQWFIVHQCRPWIEMMYGEHKGVVRVK